LGGNILHSTTRASTSPAIYDDERVAAIKPYPHVAETLSALRDRGLKLAVVTDAHYGNALKRLKKAGLSDRQVQAVRYVREHGAITNKEYRELTGLSPRAALRELMDLCTREVLVKQGTTGRSTVYLLKKIKPAKHAITPTFPCF
jgi:hypothetical protein